MVSYRVEVRCEVRTPNFEGVTQAGPTFSFGGVDGPDHRRTGREILGFPQGFDRHERVTGHFWERWRGYNLAHSNYMAPTFRSNLKLSSALRGALLLLRQQAHRLLGGT